MPFKNFKSPTVKEPMGGYYEKIMDCLLLIQEGNAGIYKELDDSPQFEYDVLNHFHDVKSARDYVNGLVSFLEEHVGQKKQIQLQETLIQNAARDHDGQIW
jgi:hypothetical protein